MKQANPELIVAGGGPAGMMAALLFARAGVSVTVLEKHADFFRDFRGDTVHPSTMQILDEMGLLAKFLMRPHNRIDSAEIDWNGTTLHIGDLSHLKMPAPFIAMMPQWEFLDFLRDEAERIAHFTLRMEAEVASLIEDGTGRVSGVRLGSGEELHAGKLVLMCDGRGSLVRSILPVQSLGVPIDVFWFAIPKASAGQSLRGAVRGNRLFVLIDRGDYWQCAFVIAKGSAEQIRARGIEAFRDELRTVLPVDEALDLALSSFENVRLLSVSLDRLTQWFRPGLLAIGDAAHAMSPVGGIGINLAIQDAVCAANILAGPMTEGRTHDPLLKQVQDRRMLPTRIIQSAQSAVHRSLLQPLVTGTGGISDQPPIPARLLNRFPLLRRIPGYFIGHGIRMEHVTAPQLARFS